MSFETVIRSPKIDCFVIELTTTIYGTSLHRRYEAPPEAPPVVMLSIRPDGSLQLPLTFGGCPENIYIGFVNGDEVPLGELHEYIKLNSEEPPNG